MNFKSEYIYLVDVSVDQCNMILFSIWHFYCSWSFDWTIPWSWITEQNYKVWIWYHLSEVVTSLYGSLVKYTFCSNPRQPLKKCTLLISLGYYHFERFTKYQEKHFILFLHSVGIISFMIKMWLIHTVQFCLRRGHMIRAIAIMWTYISLTSARQLCVLQFSAHEALHVVVKGKHQYIIYEVAEWHDPLRR